MGQSEKAFQLTKEEIPVVGQQHKGYQQHAQEHRGDDVIVAQGVGHRVARHAVHRTDTSLLLDALGKKSLLVKDGDINIRNLHANLVSRQVERVGLTAIMYLAWLESSLDGGVLLGWRSITRQ